MKIGIVGCGAVVQEFYVRVLPRVKGAEIIGVCDLNKRLAEEVALAFGVLAVDLGDLVRSCDWILVATPPESHSKIAKVGLEAGCNVAVEKPFVSSLGDGESLVAMARNLGRALCVAQFRRVFPVTELARQLVRDGLIGEVTGFEVFEGGKFVWAAQSDYVSRSKYGGVLFDTGSHSIDQALFVSGLDSGPMKVAVDSVARDKAEPSHEIDAKFEMECDRGHIKGRVFLSRAQSLANVIRVFGSKGWIEFEIGVSGSVYLGVKDRPIRLVAEGNVKSYGDAFLKEYQEMFSKGRDSIFRAESTLNQLRVIEAIHQHG